MTAPDAAVGLVSGAGVPGSPASRARSDGATTTHMWQELRRIHRRGDVTEQRPRTRGVDSVACCCGRPKGDRGRDDKQHIDRVIEVFDAVLDQLA